MCYFVLSKFGEDMELRLNKFISDSGMCSRREADKLIEQGKVSVNGKRAEMGTKVSEKDKVIVNGKLLKAKAKPKAVYIAMNKPVGITCTTDTNIKGNVITFLKFPQRIFPIGRLDKPSEGLLLLTNDGDIVNKILRAGNQHEKEYVVTVNKNLRPDFVEKMGAPVDIGDAITKPCKVKKEGDQKFRITLTQGLNRQIRRMCEVLGYEVKTLKRVRIMNIKLGDIGPGKWRNLTPAEMKLIFQAIKDSSNEAFVDVENE
jgi:23S rRNA pseudouridine2604 synthase